MKGGDAVILFLSGLAIGATAGMVLAALLRANDDDLRGRPV